MFEKFTHNKSAQSGKALYCADSPFFRVNGKRFFTSFKAIAKPVVKSTRFGLLLLLSGTGSIAWGEGVKFTSCSENAPMTLTKIAMTPYPPVIAKPMVEIWSFQTQVPITSGATMAETWKLGNFVYMQRTLDLCQTFAKSGVPCPLKPGNYTIRGDFNTQSTIPPFVTISVHRVKKNGDGSQLMCYDINLKFLP